MSGIINYLFGQGKDLNAIQMGMRAFVMFFITLCIIRIAGMRSFGQKSAFDTIIVIMLGAILSRAVAGASAFFPTVMAGLIMALTHRLIALISVYSETVGSVMKGEKRILFINNQFVNKNMLQCCVSKKDLLEEVRLNLNEPGIDNVKIIYMERSGKISVIKKTDEE